MLDLSSIRTNAMSIQLLILPATSIQRPYWKTLLEGDKIDYLTVAPKNKYLE